MFHKPDKDGWVSYGWTTTGKLVYILGQWVVKPEKIEIKIN